MLNVCICVQNTYIYIRIRPGKWSDSLTLFSPKTLTEMKFQSTLENIMFPVEVRPVQSYFGHEVAFGQQLSTVVLAPSLNEGRGKVLNLAGSAYAVERNEDFFGRLIEQTRSNFGDNLTIKVRAEDDRRFWVSLLLEDHAFAVGQATSKKDFLTPSIEMQNSYDGSLCRRTALGYWRQVCTNGLMAFSSVTFDDSTRHTKHMPKLDLSGGAFQDAFHALTKGGELSTLTDRRLFQHEIEAIIEDLKADKTSTAFPKRLIDDVQERMLTECEQLGVEPTAWLLYNGFNFMLNHSEKIGLRTDVKEVIDRKVLSLITRHLN